jgi:hypothetical protein
MSFILVPLIQELIAICWVCDSNINGFDRSVDIALSALENFFDDTGKLREQPILRQAKNRFKSFGMYYFERTKD